jgi:hypothetical protein
MTAAVIGAVVGSAMIVAGLYACLRIASHDDDVNGRW